MVSKDSTSLLPSDVPGLQSMVLDLRGNMEKVVKNYEVENQLLREQIQLLKHQLYGRKSEKLSSISNGDDDSFEQSSLFDDDRADGSESESESESVSSETNEEITVITVPAHKRKKRGRKKLPESLPRIEVVHDLSKDEKQCGCGCEMSRIGREESEKLEMFPARFWVVRHVRYKYACKNCEGVERNEDEGEPSVKIAPVPMQLIPKSIATPSLLSHILVSKYCDSLPFYRQEKQFLRLGFELSRSSMCTWSLMVAEKCKPLVELLREHILSGPLINIDETTFQVLKEPERRVDRKSFMWVSRGGPAGNEAVVYHYAENRSRSVASVLIGDYRGYIQTDGYAAYDFLNSSEGITHVGCWAHVRRKFLDVVKASGNKKGKGKGLGKSGEALATIRELYKIEKEADELGLSPTHRYEERQKRSKPILEEFEEKLRKIALTTPPKSSLGKALNYTLGQWPRLIKYLGDGIIKMDNNLAENAIRPFVVGRKNWLFFDQPGGAEAGAVIYSLIETAKANGLEPYRYLCYLFDKLPLAEGEEQLKELLPMKLNPEILEEHHKNYRERWKK